MTERTRISDELTTDEMEELEADMTTWKHYDPSDDELARRDAMIERGWREWAALVFPIVALLIAGACMWHNDASAQNLTASRVIDGVPHEWTLPEEGCTILRAWEDHSAIAFCPSDTYAYDPDGSDTREAGVWYVADYTN